MSYFHSELHTHRVGYQNDVGLKRAIKISAETVNVAIIHR